MLRNNVVTVDLGKIRQNYLLQKSLLPRKTEIMPVVKADAYGHGMVPVATALHSMGAKHFAVALAEEGVELREGGISGEILVLGPAMEEAAEEPRPSLPQKWWKFWKKKRKSRAGTH